ncbi:MAG: hypothetical protein A2189_05665 [Paenibacillus sp. RIFOXYA1_FULL_44_5]|nr:MAG: hypothetical protein A2189_05665 [Paenibacillus sp. RIFOXYA1_FULL_44_5]
MLFKQFHRNIQIRLLANFISSLSYNMVLPFMSIYFAERLGTTKAGLLLSISVIVSLVSGIYGGYFADRVGRKKLMIVSEGIWLISYTVMTIANSPWLSSPILTFLMMILVSLCWGLFGPASNAMILDVTGPDSRKFVYSLFYWSNNLSVAVGGIAGAFFFKAYLFELLMILMGISLFTFLVTVFWIEETYDAKLLLERKQTAVQGKGIFNMFHNYREVFRDSTFMLYMIASLLIVSVEFHLMNYTAIRLANEIPTQALFSWNGFRLSIDGVQMLGYLRTENTLLVVVLSLAVLGMFRRFSDQKVLIAGFLLYVVGYSVVSYSSQPWVLLLSMLIATLGEVMYVPVNQAYLGVIAPEHARSSYLAVYSIVFKGAMLIGAFGITLGGIFPDWLMSLLILSMVLAGVLIFAKLLPSLQERHIRQSAYEARAASEGA